MEKTRFAAAIAGVLLALLAVSGIGAQASRGYLEAPAFSADPDPDSLWDQFNNPAAWGRTLEFAAGFYTQASLDELAARRLEGAPYALALGLPGLLYRYADDGTGSPTQELIASFGMGKAVSSGLRYRSGGAWDLSYLIRPNAALSLSLGLTDALSASPLWDFGLAVRPLAFIEPRPELSSVLTLSATARYGDADFRWREASARVRLDGAARLGASYDFGSGALSLSLTMALGPTETSVAVPDLAAAAASPAGERLGFGAALLADPRFKARPAFVAPKAAALVIDGAESAVPSGIAARRSGRAAFDLYVESALAAADDPRIGALIILEPPEPPSEAAGQAFARALDAFRAAGKPVYAYVRNAGRGAYLYLASQADHLAIDPNGSVALVEPGGARLYFRGFFDKLGLRFHTLRSHDEKTAYDAFTEYGMTAAEREGLERYLGGLSRQAAARLAAGRAGRLGAEASAVIAAGPYLVSAKAVAAGLAEELAYRDEFLEGLEARGWTKRVGVDAYRAARDEAWGAHPLAKAVVVLGLSGSIIEGPGVAGASIGESAAARLAELRDDAAVAGVILRVDSGGGSAAVSDYIAREARRFREAGKPLFVSMGGYAASGGYYISAFAERIWAEEGTITGSIGVTGLMPDASGLVDKLGLRAEAAGPGDNADFANPLLPHRPGDAVALNEAIASIYARFIATVSEGRGLSPERADELGKGQVWLGAEAKALGLVDEIGGLDAAVGAMRRRLGGPIQLRYESPGSLMDWGPWLMSASGLARSGLIRTLTELGSAAATIEAMGTGPLLLEPASLLEAR